MLCIIAWHASFLFAMFDRWTKNAASKITDTAVESAKQTLNDRIDKYGDIIQIGLVLGVIILGSRHITRRSDRRSERSCYLPDSFDGRNPVYVVNNFYKDKDREREDYTYERRNQKARGYSYIQDGQVRTQPQKKANQKY